MPRRNQDNSETIVEAFFHTKEKRDLEGLKALFADNIVYIFPLPASGAQENWFVYDGKDATVEYQRRTLDAFSQLKMRDMQVTIGADGNTVFVESKGDYVSKEGKPYNNVYIFKFVLDSGKIVKVFEYANPVTYALLAGLPIAGRDLRDDGPR